MERVSWNSGVDSVSAWVERDDGKERLGVGVTRSSRHWLLVGGMDDGEDVEDVEV